MEEMYNESDSKNESFVKKCDVDTLLELIKTGNENEVIRFLDDHPLINEAICMKLLKDEDCQRDGKFRGPVLEAAEHGHEKIMSILIARGFSPREVNLSDDFRTQPIHVACSLGHLHVLQFLVEEHGVSVDEIDFTWSTPLYYCFLRCNPNTIDIVRYLLVKGASVNWLTVDKISPLEECVATSWSTTEMCRLLLSYGAGAPFKTKSSPLHIAARKDRIDFAEILLDAGASVNVDDEHGLTPFMLATYYNHLGMLRFLYSHGADPDRQDNGGETSLHLAIRKGFYAIVRYLVVEIGVTLNLKNRYNLTPLQRAVTEVRTDMVELFVKANYKPSSAELKYFGWHHLLRKEGVKELTEYITRSLLTLPNLQDICTFTIRRVLGRRLPGAVSCLPLPEKLKNLVLLSHV